MPTQPAPAPLPSTKAAVLSAEPPQEHITFLGRFLVLKSAIPELWVSLAIKMLAFFAYTVMNGTLTVWLSSDLGYNDVQAGLLVVYWSAIMTLITVLVGSFTDAIGLRKTLLIGTCTCLLARVVMTSTV